MQSKDKITYWIFCLSGVIISFNVASISAVVPSIAKALGIPEFVVGKIIWAYMLPYGVCALFYGPLTRKFAIKNILVVCLSLFSVFSIFSGIAQSFEALFVYRFIVGIFSGAITPLTLVYISHNFGLEQRGKVVGRFFSITFIASLIGLFLSGIIDWRWIFFIPAIISLISVIVILKLLPSLKIDSEEVKSRYFEALTNAKVFRVFAYIFLVSLLYHAAQQWLGVYFNNRYHLSQFMISLLLTLVSLAGFFGEVIGGHHSDKHGRVITLKRGVFLMAISLFALPLLGKLWFLALVVFIWGLGWTINHAGLSTYLTDLPKPYLREASSLNSSVRFISGGVGTALGGIVMQRSFIFSFIGIAIILLVLSLFTDKILKT